MTRMSKFTLIVLSLLLILSINASAITERIEAGAGITAVKFANGLTVIIKPVRTSAVVCVQASVRAGSIYEGKWLGAGLSHLCEHLVADSTTGDDPPCDMVAEIGGQANASTSLAETRYYICASATKTKQCIELIAGWLNRPKIRKEDFLREHSVVQRELEMRADDPMRQLRRAHASGIFSRHPAAIPVIGYSKPLSKLTLTDVQEYIDLMYVPQNMVFCIVGDVDTDEVLRWTQQAWASTRAGRVPQLLLPDVKPLSSPRRSVKRHKDVKETIEMLSFQTIPLAHADLYALDVLSYILTEGSASRLVQNVQRGKKLVTSINSYSWTPHWGKGHFCLVFRASPAKADQAQRAILDELKRIVAGGVQDEELARAKRQKTADYVFSRQTCRSIADTLASDYLATGDVTFSKNYTKRIGDVTARQVQRAAKKYFTFDRAVVTRMISDKKSAAASTQATQKQAESKAQFFKLKNGLRVILHPTDAVGLVSLAFVTRGGLLVEDESTNGLGALMTALSTKGAGKRSAEDIAKFFDSAGGSIQGNCGNNSFYWQATVLKDSLAGALDILADVIIKPTLSSDELEILKPVKLAQVKKIDEDWQRQLHKFFRRKFYDKSNPYRMLPDGCEKVIESATAGQIREYHKKHIGAEAGVLAIYGNFNLAETKLQVERVFSALKRKAPPLRTFPAGKIESDELHVLKTSNRVAGVILAVRGMTLSDPDRYPITVLDTIISGYRLPAGWLHEELRGKGLVYMVHAYNRPGLAGGAFMVEAACQPEKVQQVVGIIRKHLKRALTYKPTREEIDKAVDTIVTAERLAGQAMSQLSLSSALDELYGFGYDFRTKLEKRYRRVTPADIHRVAVKYFSKPITTTITTPNREK